MLTWDSEKGPGVNDEMTDGRTQAPGAVHAGSLSHRHGWLGHLNGTQPVFLLLVTPVPFLQRQVTNVWHAQTSVGGVAPAQVYWLVSGSLGNNEAAPMRVQCGWCLANVNICGSTGIHYLFFVFILSPVWTLLTFCKDDLNIQNFWAHNHKKQQSLSTYHITPLLYCIIDLTNQCWFYVIFSVVLECRLGDQSVYIGKLQEIETWTLWFQLSK